MSLRCQVQFLGAHRARVDNDTVAVDNIPVTNDVAVADFVPELGVRYQGQAYSNTQGWTSAGCEMEWSEAPENKPAMLFLPTLANSKTPPVVIKVEAAGDISGDPYQRKDSPELRSGEWNDDDNVVTIDSLGGPEYQDIRVETGSLDAKEGSSHPAKWTYMKELLFPDGTKCYFSLLKPESWGYQHIHRFACRMPDGSLFRINNLGHTAHRSHPGLITIDSGRGTPSYKWDSAEAQAGLSIDGASIKAVRVNLTPRDKQFLGISVKIGKIQFILIQVVEDDPALINGQIRRLAWTGADLKSLDGIGAFSLRGEDAVNIQSYVAGVVNGGDPAAASAASVEVSEEITEIFGDDWAQ
ncbi:MAG: hypothetical protein U0525_03615 [Patescibacteria group bacterium]